MQAESSIAPLAPGSERAFDRDTRISQTGKWVAVAASRICRNAFSTTTLEVASRNIRLRRSPFPPIAHGHDANINGDAASVLVPEEHTVLNRVILNHRPMERTFVIAELTSREVDVVEQAVIAVPSHDLGP